MSTVAARLRLALDGKGLRASILAYRCGVDRSTISNYLNGKYVPKTEMLLKICEALDVSPEWLSGYEIDPDLAKPETMVLTPGEAKIIKNYAQ